MTIAVVGTGYVGLVTGAVFADFGNSVWCLDIDEKKIKGLKQGKLPFHEPGLSEIVLRNIAKSRISFTADYGNAISSSDVVFICVGTPSKNNGQANLDYLFSAVEETAKHLKKYTLVVIKSTIPVGLEQKLIEAISKYSKADFELASCPEFLREGSAVEDAIHPDRIVLGVSSKKAERLLLDLYKPFNGQRLICDLKSAQLIKYVSNSFLAMKISFANMVANLCEEVGADAETVLKGVKMDARIGQHFLSPGVGYGGSCFPKDVSAFISMAQDYSQDFSLLREVAKININQVNRFVKKVEGSLGTLKGKSIGVLGLSFKPNTDDVREAPSIRIVQALLDHGAKVKVYDPMAMDRAKEVLPKKVEFCKDAYMAVEDTSAMLIVTDWNEFKELDLGKVKKLMKKLVIIDGRNIYEPNKVKSLGFKYFGVGRS